MFFHTTVRFHKAVHSRFITITSVLIFIHLCWHYPYVLFVKWYGQFEHFGVWINNFYRKVQLELSDEKLESFPLIWGILFTSSNWCHCLPFLDTEGVRWMILIHYILEMLLDVKPNMLMFSFFLLLLWWGGFFSFLFFFMSVSTTLSTAIWLWARQWLFILLRGAEPAVANLSRCLVGGGMIRAVQNTEGRRLFPWKAKCCQLLFPFELSSAKIGTQWSLWTFPLLRYIYNHRMCFFFLKFTHGIFQYVITYWFVYIQSAAAWFKNDRGTCNSYSDRFFLQAV